MDIFIWRTKKIRLATAIILCLILIHLSHVLFFNLREIPPKPRPSIQKPSTYSHSACPKSISNDSITSITSTRYLMVSAFRNDDATGQIHIITIMNRTHSELFNCIFCCNHHGLDISSVILDKHTEHFGFPYVTTSAFCNIESSCNATHVTISRPEDVLNIQSHSYLPIYKFWNHEKEFDVEFTLCITCLFGRYNNVLQFVQTIETYKLLGVQRMVIYNTSCGPDLKKVLQNYVEEGMLEIIPWPIHRFLKPSEGWSYELHSGEVHYYGQQATINDCIYKNRQRSRYVLINDADEIIMPYQHSSLQMLMSELQERNTDATSFIFQTHVFSKEVTRGTTRFDIPEWRHVPGINILRHIYREPIQWGVNNPGKMIVNPRKVTQTSVHTVIKSSGKTVLVPKSLAIVMHTAKPKQPSLGVNRLTMDDKIWEYAEKMIPNVNKVLKKSGFLN